MADATLAAIVIVYSVGLIKPAEFRAILKVRRTEFVWAVVALAGVVLLGTLQGILVAIVVSLVALAYQVANPPVYVLGRKPGTNVFRPQTTENPYDEDFPGLLLLRLEGRIFFANAERVGHKIRLLIETSKPDVVVLHLRSVFDLEYTALKMLMEAEARYREHDIRFHAGRLFTVATNFRSDGEEYSVPLIFFDGEETKRISDFLWKAVPSSISCVSLRVRTLLKLAHSSIHAPTVDNTD